ncbi:hypothetical protein SeLEV6574_g03848 [Synchytrium endobioticum]|uniref:GAG-pre-integrase domain-containing protein n=1 Tax=Synchytrium endobioticum TaxID=286115 RepID=A0A507D1Y0_9FUNG|nr:hypothetical protein SeLEV6574_g03848 [Synchytrium endobioticum]
MLRNINVRSAIFTNVNKTKDAHTLRKQIESQFIAQNKGHLYTMYSQLLTIKQDDDSVLKYSNRLKNVVTDIDTASEVMVASMVEVEMVVIEEEVIIVVIIEVIAINATSLVIAANCQEQRSNIAEGNVAEEEVEVIHEALVSSHINPGSTYWKVDSGCTHHMTDDLSILANIHPLPTPQLVRGIGGKFGRNLVSARQLAKVTNSNIVLGSNSIAFRPGRNFPQVTVKLDNIACEKCILPIADECYNIAVQESNLHERFGHVNRENTTINEAMEE